MTPDPAPYGADLPIIARLRDEQVEFWYGGEPTVGPLLAALDAANAEVLALREVVEAVRKLALCAPDTGQMSSQPGGFTPVDAAIEDFAHQLWDLLPAPTGDDGRG